MFFRFFEKIKPSEIAYVYGGVCQCICNKKPDGENLHGVGKARHLEECSKVCLESQWKIYKCDTASLKKDEKK